MYWIPTDLLRKWLQETVTYSKDENYSKCKTCGMSIRKEKNRTVQKYCSKHCRKYRN